MRLIIIPYTKIIFFTSCFSSSSQCRNFYFYDVIGFFVSKNKLKNGNPIKVSNKTDIIGMHFKITRKSSLYCFFNGIYPGRSLMVTSN